MKAVFLELPAFERYRSQYFDDDAFRAFQDALLRNPDAGDVIQGAGGPRKVRFADGRRQKGKRGGIRVIYFWWPSGAQFWLFTLYGKDVLDDLNDAQRKVLRQLLKNELDARL
ncbi:hypothetical protein WCE55_11660 [Luteimonas sp. MJ293]|uniref:hypothetical protein n=1 Tax=Luteimonas sp. MJ146 TaxID=3129240 RepID=UPI0031BB0FF2